MGNQSGDLTRDDFSQVELLFEGGCEHIRIEAHAAKGLVQVCSEPLFTHEPGQFLVELA